MIRNRRATPTVPDLLADLVEGTDRMLSLHRAALLRGTEPRVELPKLLLEMVRCMVMARRLDPRVESPCRTAAHDDLWRDLVSIQQLAPGAALDMQLRQLGSSWWEFAAVTAEELTLARRHSSDADGLGWQTSPMSALRGCLRTHPDVVQPLLRRETPCPGLVEAAAQAFVA